MTQEFYSSVLIKRTGNICPLSMNVNISFYHNIQKLETIQMSINSRINKLIYPNNGILLSNEKERTVASHNKMIQ